MARSRKLDMAYTMVKRALGARDIAKHIRDTAQRVAVHLSRVEAAAQRGEDDEMYQHFELAQSELRVLRRRARTTGEKNLLRAMNATHEAFGEKYA